jgi:hypothetical protein
LKRPIGHTVIAVLVALWSVSHLSNTVRNYQSAFGIAASPWQQMLSVASAIVGVTAAAALWFQRRWARAAYAVWAVLATGVFAYDYFVVTPAMSRMLLGKMSPSTPWSNIVLVPLALDFLVWAGVLGLGYWYLRATPIGAGSPPTTQRPD